MKGGGAEGGAAEEADVVYHVFGDRGGEAHGGVGDGVIEGEAIRVEKMARLVSFFAVERVSEDGTAEVFEVDSDLVRAAGFGSGEDKAGFLVEGSHLDFGDRFSSVGEDGHFFPMDGMAANRHLEKS